MIKRTLLLVGLCAAVGAFTKSRQPSVALAEPTRGFFGSSDLQAELDSTRGELDLLKAQVERNGRIFHFSSHYGIGANLAEKIYDIAMAEGIEPDLAFRVVKIESDFNTHATSPVGAIGLAQVMPSTAKFFDRTATRERLYNPDMNLRVGFRYLRTLIRQHKGNVGLALLEYNRGPVAIQAQRALGKDPSNGYEHAVMRGYHGTGIIE